MVNPNALQRRAEIIRAIRRFFDAEGFVEVTTPVRIAAPAPEPHIDCPPVQGTDGAPVTYLRASPELEMKRLLAAGMDLIYQIGPCFREGERGEHHHPEFTMIEWYRRAADYRAILTDLERLVLALRKGVDAADFTVLAVRDAYREFAGWDPWTDWDQDRFDVDMALKVEPALKTRGMVFLVDYPPAACSLARLRGAGAEAVAERWEFYWDGIELANCFTELCDGDEQRRRFEAAKAERAALGESDYPIDEGFLAALPRIGSAAGVALGVDRLVMLLCGENDIHAVMAN